MITSWNVNQFFGADNWTKLTDDEKLGYWKNKDYMQKAFDFILSKLAKHDDLVILNEVPNTKQKNYDVFKKQFTAFYKKNKLTVIEPLNCPASYGKTVAICQNGSYEQCYDEIIDLEFGSYRNRILAVRGSACPQEIVFGVHIPIYESSKQPNSVALWNSLILTHRKISEKGNRIIYIGDINTYQLGTVNKNKLIEFMSEGLVDFWLEKGHSHNRATFNSGARIDYALVTDKDYSALAKKYDMEIDDSTREGDKPLSDHSAIILREKTKT